MGNLGRSFADSMTSCSSISTCSKHVNFDYSKSYGNLFITYVV